MLYFCCIYFRDVVRKNMTAEKIRQLRKAMGLTQHQFAAKLGVSFAAVNRWEKGRNTPQPDRLLRIQELQAEYLTTADAGEQPSAAQKLPVRLDFEGDPDAVKLVVDAFRLRNGHLFNKAYGLELSRVVPLPHQRIAVYENLLPLSPLRFLLADDAGAGKTIMAGLYILEMLNRGRIKRVGCGYSEGSRHVCQECGKMNFRHFIVTKIEGYFLRGGGEERSERRHLRTFPYDPALGQTDRARSRSCVLAYEALV
jgi:transcriptional regulator with XRE-family HTH domain